MAGEHFLQIETCYSSLVSTRNVLCVMPLVLDILGVCSHMPSYNWVARMQVASEPSTYLSGDLIF